MSDQAERATPGTIQASPVGAALAERMPPKADAPLCGLCGEHSWCLCVVAFSQKVIFGGGDERFRIELMACQKCADSMRLLFLRRALAASAVEETPDA